MEEARQALQRLAAQGVVLTHPALYKQEDERYTAVHGEYDDSRGWDAWTYTQRLTHGWRSYPVEDGKKHGEALIYWTKRKGADIAAAAVETSLEPHTLALRVVIAERLAAKAKCALQEAALTVAQELDMFTARAKGERASMRGRRGIPDLGTLDPAAVWTQYEQERKQFEGVTRTWDGNLSRINALEQLFLISG